MNFHKQGAVMNISIPVILMTIFSTLGMAVSAHAQEQNHLDVNTVVQKELVTVNDAGEENIELRMVGVEPPGIDSVQGWVDERRASGALDA